MSTDLITLIRDAGVVGAGGAGFPTHIKVSSQAEFVIVNGAECEPLLRVDQQLLDVRAIEVISGLKAVMENTGAKKGIIALKKKYHRAIERIKQEISQVENIELFLLDDFYPAGDEQILVYEVLNRIIPEGGIPLNVGVIVSNVETLLNVHNAANEISVHEKYVTITGKVKKTMTVKVPIGVSVEEVIQLAGGVLVTDFKVIDGGPMMGKVIENIQSPITKMTKGLIVLPSDHHLILSKQKPIENMMKMAKSTCCHCSLCSDICPRNLIGHGLHPDKLMRIASYSSTCDNHSLATDAYLCTGCSLCEVVCVMNLQPWKINQFLKGQLMKEGIKNPNNRKPQKANQFRDYRKFPSKKLIRHLGLEQYNVAAPLNELSETEFKSVSIKKQQHIGAKAEAIVEIGDYVTKGQLIADVKKDQLGSPVHASISGNIISINEDEIKICSI